MAYHNRVVGLRTDEICKYIRIFLANCPTSHVADPSLTKSITSPPSAFTPDSRKVYVVKCPTPEGPQTDPGDNPINSPAIFIVDSLAELRVIPIDDAVTKPWPSQKIDDIDTASSNTTLDIEVHHANRHIYTLEKDSSFYYVRRRTYTATGGIYTKTGVTETLRATSIAAGNFPITLKLSRKRGQIFSVFEYDPAAGNPTIVRQLDLDYNDVQTITTQSAGSIWYACPDPDKNVLWTFHGDIGLFKERTIDEYDLVTLVETEILKASDSPGPNIPTPAEHRSILYADANVNVFFDLDQGTCRRWTYGTAASRTDSPTVSGTFHTYLRDRQKLVYDAAPDELWWQDYQGGNAEKIWDASEDGLSTRTVIKADCGID